MAVLSDKPTKHQMPEKRAFNKAIRERNSGLLKPNCTIGGHTHKDSLMHTRAGMELD